MPNHQRDRFVDIAVEEPDAKDLVGGTHLMSIQYPNLNIEQKPEAGFRSPAIDRMDDLPRRLMIPGSRQPPARQKPLRRLSEPVSPENIPGSLYA